MPAKAYAKEKWLHVLFGEKPLRAGQTLKYNLGSALAGFLRVDSEALGRMYDSLIREVLSLKAGRLSAECENLLATLVSEINSESPYLIFYTDIITGVLLSVSKGKHFDMAPVFRWLPQVNRLSEQYDERFEEDSRNAGEILARYYPSDALEGRSVHQQSLMLRGLNSILYVKEAVLLDLVSKRDVLSEELELLYGGDGSSCGEASVVQRLMAFDLERSRREGKEPYYIDAEFFVKREALPGEGRYPEVCEVYHVPWVDDIIRLEFFKTLEAGALIRRCENCGRLFAPSGRVDTIYCGSVFKDTGRTCAEIGALKRYREKTVSDPAHEAFNKAYKRNNSRVRNNKMTKKEFAGWLKEAKKRRELCSAGEMTPEEFSEWLGNKKK